MKSHNDKNIKTITTIKTTESTVLIRPPGETQDKTRSKNRREKKERYKAKTQLQESLWVFRVNI